MEKPIEPKKPSRKYFSHRIDSYEISIAELNEEIDKFKSINDIEDADILISAETTETSEYSGCARIEISGSEKFDSYNKRLEEYKIQREEYDKQYALWRVEDEKTQKILRKKELQDKLIYNSNRIKDLNRENSFIEETLKKL